MPNSHFTNKKNQFVTELQKDPSVIIDVKDLKIVFDENTPDEKLIINNFSHQFKKGQIYFLIGNSGTGKTTLVSHFNGLLKSKYGTIRIGNNIIDGKKRKIKNFKQLRKTVGMVFQFPEYQLFKDTIEKDIMFGPVNLGVKKAQAKLLAKKYLNQMGLDDSFLSRSPFGLSGGQKRRVAIAGILAIEPEVLVFDEPTAGLDPSGEIEMLEIISNLKKSGKTVIVITHVMDQVLSVGDQVIVLGDQKVLKIGSPYEVFSDLDLMKQTSLDLPKVIETIHKLATKNPIFKKLYDYQPRNAEELAIAIDKVTKTHRKSNKPKSTSKLRSKKR